MLRPTQQIQLRYWTLFHATCRSQGMTPPSSAPVAHHYTTFGIGTPGIHISAFMNTRKNSKQVGVGVVLEGRERETQYAALLLRRAEIEREIGSELDWITRIGTHRMISLRWHGVDPKDETLWTAQHNWLMENVELFDRVFGPIVRDM